MPLGSQHWRWLAGATGLNSVLGGCRPRLGLDPLSHHQQRFEVKLRNVLKECLLRDVWMLWVTRDKLGVSMTAESQ